MNRSNIMLAAALDYIAQGFKVIPIESRGKLPLVRPQGVIADKVTARRFWRRFPDANIAILADNILALDFDQDCSGSEGTLRYIELKLGGLPRTQIHRTGGGGLHYLYLTNGIAIPSISVVFGVIVIGQGGWVIMPPSIHESGSKYEILDNTPIAPAPQWLIMSILRAWAVLTGRTSFQIQRRKLLKKLQQQLEIKELLKKLQGLDSSKSDIDMAAIQWLWTRQITGYIEETSS